MKNPSWRNRYRLAWLEARRGRIEEARRQIGTILAQDRGNLWAQERLGLLELMYGDIGQAEQIYKELAGVDPRATSRTISGRRTSSRGRSEGGGGLSERALKTAPDHAPALVNLAEAEVELGQERLQQRATIAGPRTSLEKRPRTKPMSLSLSGTCCGRSAWPASATPGRRGGCASRTEQGSPKSPSCCSRAPSSTAWPEIEPPLSERAGRARTRPAQGVVLGLGFPQSCGKKLDERP